MAEYISREAAIEKITALINKSGKYTAYESGADDACYIVEHEVPAADVRPVVRGKWAVEDHGDYQLIECDKCHALMWNHQEDLPNFCYNCGADMRGGADDA